jgi:hypothetical protein
MVSIDSCFASSMKAQVLITTVSASSRSWTIWWPRRPSSPSIISLSTRFFGQPRLIMPTRDGCSLREEAFIAGRVYQIDCSWAGRRGAAIILFLHPDPDVGIARGRER